MKSLKHWLLATRPKTLFASVAPVVMGLSLALAEAQLNYSIAAITLLAAVLIQIGTNFANDYYDFKKGADTQERLGPTRMTQAGLVSPQSMKWAFILTFAGAFGLGAYLAFIGGWPIVVVGILSIVFGILYTGGPFALAYKGIADIFVLFFFGPIAVHGTYYLQTMNLTAWQPIVLGFSPGLLATAILVVNNLRDIDTDVKAGKMTLAVRMGRTFTQIQYTLLVGAALVLPAVIVLLESERWYSLIYLLALPLVIVNIMAVFRTSEPRLLNPLLGKTALSLIIVCFLFAIGYQF